MYQKGPKKSKSIMFTRFLASYLALLALPILLFSYILASTTRKIEQNAIDQNLMVLEQTRDQIDNKMRSLYNCVIGVNYNSIINRVLDTESSRDVADMMMSFKDLSAFEMDGDRLYIYSDSMDALLSSKGCYNRIDKIYGTVLQYADMSYQQFNDTFLTPAQNGHFVPAADVIVDSQATRAILYVQSVPIGPAGHKLGNILYFVQESSLLQPLSRLQREEGGWVCISDGNNQIIAGYGQYPENLLQRIEENGAQAVSYSNDMILTSVQSSYNDWRYTAAIPKQYILEESNTVRLTVLLLLLLYMLVGVCFSFFVSAYNIKPLRELTDLVRDSRGDRSRRVNEYNLLRGYVEDLIHNNRDLETSLDSYAKAMEATQITNLICGRYDTLDELTEFPDCRAIIAHSCFTVVLVDFFPKLTVIDQSVLDALIVRRLMVNQMVAELELPGLAMGEIDINKLGLLFYGDQSLVLDRVVEQLYRRLAENLQEQVCIGVGNSCETAQQISFSGLQADCALRVAAQESAPVVYFSQMSRHSQGFYFPENLRSALLQSVASANLKQTKSTLKILDIENFISRTVEPKELEELLHEIHLLFVHLHADNSEVEVPEPFHDEADIHNRFYRYSNLLMRICSKNTDLSESRKSKQCEEILHFVDDNYADSGLCLSRLASQFNLSEAYLSYLFKKMLNINFSNYLEEKRITKATQMLQDSSLSIEAVAVQVGYNSPHAFRRAFKKVEGINPRDLRAKKGS